MSQTNRESPPSMPPWVKALLIIFILLIILVIIMHLTGIDFGGHHMSSIEFWLQQL